MANTLRFKRGLATGIPTALAGEPLFTTDTFDLYIGNGTTNTRFQKYIASGATTQILRGDGSLYTFPLAISSPSNGQVLKYNGTSWVNDSDAGITGSGTSGQVAYFTGATTQTGSNNLFWDATNNRLGILTNTPTTSFHINSGASTQGGAIFGKGSYNYATLSQLGSSGDALFGAGVIASATAGEVAKSVGDVGHYIKMQISDGITFHTNITGTTGTSLARSTNERARFFASTGNFGIGTGASDSGQRLQVVGTSYFSDSVGIGSTTLTGYGLRINRDITGATSSFGVSVGGQILSGVTSTAALYATNAVTENATFTLTNLTHYRAAQGALGASSTVTNQYGFFVDSTLIGATNDFAFYGNIAAATGRWNLYMNGTAANYLAGDLIVGEPRLAGASWSRYAVVGNINFDKVILGYLASTTNGATIGANNGALSAWARLNVAGSDILFRIAEVEHARLTSLGNLHLGTFSSDSGEKLQVTGTAKITGATSIGGAVSVTGGNLTVIKNSGSPSIIGVTDGTNTTSTEAYFQATAGTTQGFVLSWGQTKSTYKILGAGDVSLYKSNTAGDVAIFNDGTSGNIKFAAGGSSTAQATLTSAGLFLLGSTSSSGERLQVTGTAKITGNLSVDGTTFNVDTTNDRVGIGTNTPAWALDIVATGAAISRIRGGGSANQGAAYFVTQGGSNTTLLAIGDGSTMVGGAVNNAMIYVNGSPLSFNMGGTTRMVLDASGNLGLGVTTNNASAKFQVDSTTQGILPPRMTTTQKNAIATPAAGLIVYDTTTNKLCCYNGTTWNDLF